MTKPIYNNLVTSVDKKCSLGNDNGVITGTRRNFKSVKSNKDGISGAKQQKDSFATGIKSSGALYSFSKQVSSQERATEQIRNARLKIKIKDYNEAIKILTNVLDNIEPGNTSAIFYRATSYLDQGNL